MANQNQQQNNVDSVLDRLLSPSPASAGGSFYGRFRQRRRFGGLIALGALGLIGLVFLLNALWWKAPPKFPTGGFIAVKEGMTIQDVSKLLAEQSIIRSAFWFKVWSVALGGDTGVKAGEYYLSAPLSVIELAKRFTRGIHNLIPTRITIPEGLSNAEIATLFAKQLKNFNRKNFLELAKKKEGYLFPDTYSFSPSATETDVIAEMEANFQKRIEPLKADMEAFLSAQAGGQSLHDILTMASLIEGEARRSETRKQVSGILWNRLDLGMPLQVDAVFPYILGKDTYEITTDDLKYDSPYNTYLYVGLPPGPINNPSLDSISAAIHPATTKYLYYLTDNEGEMRYAVTHAQHLTNRAKYLNK